MAEENLILVCVDNCEHSLRAFNWYHKHFYRDGHTVGLVHIYTPPHVPTFATGYPLEVYDGEYQRWLDEAVKKSASITQKFEELCVQRGMKWRVFSAQKIESVGHTICQVAQVNHATCIVMGQRGFGAIKRAILGSVSDFVLHHANMTVVIVPPPKHN